VLAIRHGLVATTSMVTCSRSSDDELLEKCLARCGGGDRFELLPELVGSQVSGCRMRTFGVVVPAPGLDEDDRLAA